MNTIIDIFSGNEVYKVPYSAKVIQNNTDLDGFCNSVSSKGENSYVLSNESKTFRIYNSLHLPGFSLRVGIRVSADRVNYQRKF